MQHTRARRRPPGQHGRARRRGRTTGQRGAVLVEAALVLPVLLVFLLGIMEFGLVYATGATANGATRTGARLAATNYATAGTTSTAQRAAADEIATATSADLKALNNAVPLGMTVYKVVGSDGSPAGGFPGANLVGGCTTNCFRYTWNGTTMVYQSGNWTAPDACGTTVDSIGVFVQVRHDYLTQILGTSRNVSGHTIMRLEPLPTDQCAGG